MAQQYFYDKQIRRYIQQFIRLFSGFNVQMGVNDQQLPIFQQVPVRYGDVNRMAAHITRENSENIINTVPFISCYVQSLDMIAERRTYQQYVDKVQVAEKKIDQITGELLNEPGRRYTVERYNPVPYKLTMNCDVWCSNTDQKLQLLEQILVLFNPSLDIRTTDNPYDWTSLAYVEMVNTVWSSRAVGSTIDDIIDVATLTFEVPILITPPAKVKQQKLIHTVLNQLYSLDDSNLDAFENNEPFDNSSVQYTIVTYEDRKLEFNNNIARLLNNEGQPFNDDGTTLNWKTELKPFGELREGISQIRLRKASNPGDDSNDIIGRLYTTENANELLVEINEDTLPSTTLNPINAAFDPTKNYPGDGVVPAAQLGDRYLLTNDVPAGGAWNNLSASNNDIIEFNGNDWIVAFNSKVVDTVQYVQNLKSNDRLNWNGTEWFNSYEGVYAPGYWRLYL